MLDKKLKCCEFPQFYIIWSKSLACVSVAKRSVPLPKPQATVEPSLPVSLHTESLPYQPPPTMGSPRRGSTVKIMDSMKPSHKSLLQALSPKSSSQEAVNGGPAAATSSAHKDMPVLGEVKVGKHLQCPQVDFDGILV